MTRTVYARRAAAIIAGLAAAHPVAGPWLVPAAVCAALPLALRRVGREVEFVDLDEDSLAMQRDSCLDRLSRSSNRPAGLVDVRPYGAQHDASDFFADVRKVRDSAMIIDDACLGAPDVDSRALAGADAVVFSTGPRKVIDRGEGGFAHVRDDVPFAWLALPFDAAAAARVESLVREAMRTGTILRGDGGDWLDVRPPEATWEAYRQAIEIAKPATMAHAVAMRAAYREWLGEHEALPDTFQTWRYNLLVDDADDFCARLRAVGVFAGRHYAPVAATFGAVGTFPVAQRLHRRIVNLFLDRHVDECRIALTAKVLRAHREARAAHRPPRAEPSRSTVPSRMDEYGDAGTGTPGPENAAADVGGPLHTGVHKAPPRIPFNRPYYAPGALEAVAASMASGRTAGDGPYTRHCEHWFQSRWGCVRALLTHSCTAALELAALVLGLRPGDEVIMPSYTFVSTANAFALRGAVPVFVDIRPDTMNIDERLIESAITARTRAIVVVHYAGVPCDMDAILEIARRRGIRVIEDAAQAMLSEYRGRLAGSLGDLAALSFHETKNVTCGEGGALLINDPTLVGASEVAREKGTDRSRFLRGEVDRYTWRALGSSFVPSDLLAAVLWNQLQCAEAITERRRAICERYRQWAAATAPSFGWRALGVPSECRDNGHLFGLVLPDAIDRARFIEALSEQGVQAVFHYVPLHDSPAGGQLGRASGTLPVTDELAARVVRLPVWPGVEGMLDRVVSACERAAQQALPGTFP